MKKLLLLLIGASTFIACKPAQVKSLDIKEKVILNNKTADENYIIGYEFLVENFVDSESVIELADKEAGIIKGKYYIKEIKDYAIVTVRVKDGGIKITIEPVRKSITIPKGRKNGAKRLYAANRLKIYNIKTDNMIIRFNKIVKKDTSF